MAREEAWAEACGGLTIVVGPEGCRYEGNKTVPAPADAHEKFKKILAKKLKALADRAAGKVKPKPKPEERVSFFTFAKDR